MLSDTAMVAGSETYEASLAFYNNVKAAAAQDIPGAKAIHEDLKKRYPRIPRRADTAEGALDGEAAAQ
jgi:hypothetical protein